MVEDLNALAAAMRGAYIYKVVDLCNAALCFYDFALTISQEVELIWPSKRLGPAEMLYHASRYWLLPDILLGLMFSFGPLSDTQCKAVSAYLSFSGTIGMSLSQGILVLRTKALWNGSAAIMPLLCTSCLALFAVSTYVNVQWTIATEFKASSSFALHHNGCIVIAPYRLFYIGWILTCCVDIALVALTLIKYRQERRSGCPFTRLPEALYRDAFTYFSLMLAVAVASLLVTLFVSANYRILLFGTERILYTIGTCHVILNLRAAAVRGLMHSSESGQVLVFPHLEATSRDPSQEQGFE